MTKILRAAQLFCTHWWLFQWWCYRQSIICMLPHCGTFTTWIYPLYVQCTEWGVGVIQGWRILTNISLDFPSSSWQVVHWKWAWDPEVYWRKDIRKRILRKGLKKGLVTQLIPHHSHEHLIYLPAIPITFNRPVVMKHWEVKEGVNVLLCHCWRYHLQFYGGHTGKQAWLSQLILQGMSNAKFSWNLQILHLLKICIKDVERGDCNEPVCRQNNTFIPLAFI